MALVGLKVGRGIVSGNPLGRETCVIRIDGTCVCRLGCGRAQQRNNGFCLHLQPLLWSLTAQLSQYVPGASGTASLAWSSEQVSSLGSKAESGPFKRKVSASRSPPPHSAATSAGFHSHGLWGLLFPGLELSLGSPVYSQDYSISSTGEGLCSQESPPDSRLPHMVVGPRHFVFPPLLPFWGDLLFEVT